MMPMASGSIMAAVAVLLIHIDSSAVTPNSSIAATPRCEPDSDISQKAILRSSRCTCSAVASAKPPKKRKITGSAKAAKARAVLKSGKPSSSAPTGTISAVSVVCTASVSHMMAMNSSSARPFLGAGSNGMSW